VGYLGDEGNGAGPSVHRPSSDMRTTCYDSSWLAPIHSAGRSTFDSRAMRSRANVLARLRSLSHVYPCRQCYARAIHIPVQDVKIGGENLNGDTTRKIQDVLTASRAEELRSTLSPLLPESPENNTPLSTLPPGYHFAFFPTSTAKEDTLPDGYERQFAPTSPFNRRLWSRGSLNFRLRGLPLGQMAECKEDLLKVEEGKTAMDVSVQRRIYQYSEHLGFATTWTVNEIRVLSYINKIRLLQSSTVEELGKYKQRFTRLQTEAYFTHTFTPSHDLLTHFSHLTHNFHRIHIDPEYARTIEHYPDVLVPGSLSIMVLLSAFSQFCAAQHHRRSITGAVYRFYRPLYANKLVTLTLENPEFSKPGESMVSLWDNDGRRAVGCLITYTP
jgi:hydroxyacyl-ACP dehydratase HTD2-like protein with hotdog domain